VRKKLQFEPLRAPSTQSLNGFLGVLRVLGGKKSSPFEFSDKLLESTRCPPACANHCTVGNTSQKQLIFPAIAAIIRRWTPSRVLKRRAGHIMEAEMLNDNEKFTLLYQSLIDVMNGYVENVMKTLASTIIAIGWMVTSEKSREFLASPNASSYFYLSLTAIVVISIIHAGASIGLHLRSQKIMLLLLNLDVAEPKYYEGYQITAPHLIANLIMNLSLFAILFSMIFSLR
jgi:hypothetical protein